MRYLPYLAGLGFAAIFGLSFIFTRGALDNVTPFHLLGLRFAMATVTLALLKLARLVKIKVSWADLKAMLPVFFFMPILYFPLETAGIQMTSTSRAGMIIAVKPIFVTLLSALLIKEYPSRRQLPFVLTSVAGVIFIFFMQQQETEGTQLIGSLVLLGSVLATSCYNIASRHAAERFSPLQRTWAMMFSGAVIFNSIALAQHAVAGRISTFFEPLPKVWPAILYLGVLSSVAAFFLVNYSLSHISAIQSAIFTNLVTVIAIAAGVFILKEVFHWYEALGAVAILAGVWGTNHFGPQALTKTDATPAGQNLS